MKKNKGFTLIELLAVIIILAVIALIATPTILNVIDNARRKAFEETARGYYNATRYLYDELYLKNERQDLNFTFEDGRQVSSNSNYKLEVSGEIPKGGLVYLSQSGQILVSIHNNKYCANVSNEGKVSLSDNIEDCSSKITNIPSECFIVRKTTLNKAESFDNSKEWMNKEYNMFYYDAQNDACPKEIDTLIIPSSIDGVPIEGIGYRAFLPTNFDRVAVKGVVIPDGIKVIDEMGLSSNFQARQLFNIVNLPEGLIYIGPRALASSGIKSISIPNTVQYIDTEAFQSTNLQSIAIPDSVNNMGDGVFSGNTNLTNAKFSNNMHEIPAATFSWSGLTSVTLPEGITSIGYQAFVGNKLTSLVIPDSVITIGQQAFGHNQLTQVKLGNNLTTIGIDAFETNNLSNIVIPNNITSIADSAFRNNQLTVVKLPDSITEIGSFAFAGNQLTNIEIPSSVVSIGRAAFNNNELPDDQAFIYKRNSDGSEDKTTIIGYGGVKKEGVVIPDTVEVIETFSFYDTQLVSISLPSDLLAIKNGAFQSNYLIGINIPDSVTTLEEYAFQNNQLKNVTIGSGVTNIVQNMFSGNKIENLTIGTTPGGNIVLEAGAFDNHALKQLTLGPSVTTIKGERIYSDGVKTLGAFSNNQLTKVEIPNSVTILEEYAFENNQIKELIIGNGLAKVDSFPFGGNNVEKLSIGIDAGGNVSVGGFNSNNLKELVLGDSVTEVTGGFGNNLVSLSLGNHITMLPVGIFNGNQLPDDQAFTYARNSDGSENRAKIIGYGGAKRENVITPIGATEIEQYAFSDSGIVSLTISGDIKTVPMYSLSGSQITSLTLSEGVQEVESELMSWEGTLKFLKLPSTLTTIGDSAFSGNMLTALTVPTNVISIGDAAFSDNQFENANAIKIEGNTTRFDSVWENIGFPSK